MGDEEGEVEEQQPVPLTTEVAAPGLSALRDVGNLSFNYTKLELTGKLLVDLQDLPKYPALRLLNLSDNQISDATNVNDLRDLLSANLNNNKLTSLNGLTSLMNLQLLSLTGNQIASIDTFDFPMLMYLTLDGNQLTALPPSLSSCSKLRVLEVRDNKLTSTAGIEGLNDLEEARLERNEISELFLGPLPQLKILTLANNQILSLASFSGDSATNLEQLDLSTNTLASAKELSCLQGLSRLQSLTMAESPVTGVDKYRNHVHAAVPSLGTLEGEPYSEEDREPPPEIVEEAAEG